MNILEVGKFRLIFKISPGQEFSANIWNRNESVKIDGRVFFNNCQAQILLAIYANDADYSEHFENKPPDSLHQKTAHIP